MVVTYRKGAREEAEEESAHESYIGPRCSRTLPRVVLACSPFVYLETHSRCRFVSFRKGSSSAVAAAKADRTLSHESRSSFPGGIGRETKRLVSPTMVLKRLVILLPVLAHSPFVPRGAKGSCVAFQSLGAALLKSRGSERARRSRESRSRRAGRGEKAAHAFLPPPGIDFSTSGIRRCGCAVLAPSPSAAPLSGKSVRGAFQCSLGTALTGVAVPRAQAALTRVAAVAQEKGKA